MLVVHPASTCDVCLEGYSGRSESLPHSISCGHVFCLSCLRSLRQHICPLCRSPFEDGEIRRIHVDRYEQHANSASAPKALSPSANTQKHELASNNALGLFNENPHAAQYAAELHEKITDLVLRSSSTNGVRGVRELIHEIQDFFNAEVPDNHRNLRAAFLLLYRLTELQGRFRHVESQNMELRTENGRDKQALRDLDRKYQDMQRSRARDQETARNVEASLRERLRLEELEWRRKYDFIAEEFANLRREFEESTFSPTERRMPEPPRSADSTQMYFFSADEPSLKGSERRALGKKASSNFSKDEEDMYAHFNPCLFHLSPVPPKIILTESRDELSLGCESDDEAIKEKRSQKQRSQSGISRASDSPAAMKLSPAVKPIRMPSVGRSRSDSAPYRLTARDVSSTKLAIAKEQQPEASTSAPSSYVHRDALQSHIEASQEKPMMSPEVLRLYQLLDKPTPTSAVRNIEQDISSTRPALSRSSSFHQSRSQAQLPSLLSSTQPRLNIQPSGLSVQVQAQAQALSPIQKTPPRPVLPHMHSFATYTPSRTAPAPTPVSPQETRINVGARGSATGPLPRRSSLSGGSGMGTGSAGGSPPPVFVPPSSLSFGRPHPVSSRS